MCCSWIDRIRVTSQLLRLLTSGDAVNVVVGNSTLTGCPYLLPVSTMTTQRLITSLFRLRSSASHHYHLGSDVMHFCWLRQPCYSLHEIIRYMLRAVLKWQNNASLLRCQKKCEIWQFCRKLRTYRYGDVCREALTSAFHVLRRSTMLSAGASCRDVIIIVSDVRDNGCQASKGRLFRVDVFLV